ncbi:DNA-dependent ATPase protein rad54 [Phlyctochytrium planicorne]|nr:DNA-dependent ATPase protein rad54 [Phlyctochytrium planicorne]
MGKKRRKADTDDEDSSSSSSSPEPAIKKKLKPLTPTIVSDGNVKAGGFKNGSQLGVRRQPFLVKGPLHDPSADEAIVLYIPPTITESDLFEATKSSKLSLAQPKRQVHVVVDPILGKILRPHQKQGVRFLYECVTGGKAENAFGCIMADEMGLGKTLQCITLLWTLLRQSYYCVLVKNWANELVKWLGADRIKPLSCDNKGSKQETTHELEQFVSAKGRSVVHPVLIISYESLRLYSKTIAATEIGLMLCDEGHRLKNSDSQTYQSLNALNAKRRVILSGTPIQNDLTEYYSLLSFAIPGVLGTENEFNKNFGNPILRGRDAMASAQDKEKSEAKLLELLGIANKFIIRRTAELLTKFLPVKYDYVVFCKLTDFQLQLYRHFNQSPELKRLLSGADSQPLKAITLLKKLCNHPGLVHDLKEFQKFTFPNGFSGSMFAPAFSGKLKLLADMLEMVKANKEKIVLISNYTQTLDMFDKLCRDRKYGVLRLDGSLSISKRQKLVDRFNDPSTSEFVFLLSSKAGGCGINLIGANRLVLFDPDWNPANDAQVGGIMLDSKLTKFRFEALARVWRDGQQKHCFIYRFIATGSIEEKIFQRQAQKQALSNCVVDEEENVERHFSLENLRQLFTLNEATPCDTHDAFKCKRCVNGRQTFKPKEGSAGALSSDTSNWNHISELEFQRVNDQMLRDCTKSSKSVTFIFENRSH